MPAEDRIETSPGSDDPRRRRHGAIARRLLHPAALIVIAIDLVPLIGVIFWAWDAFALLMLYWLETAVIAFWTVVRIAAMPRGGLGDIRFEGSAEPARPWALAAFVTLHAGIFMGVHFLFLRELFSSSWPPAIHGPRDFVAQVVAAGLWVPLVAVFVGRGVLTTFDIVEPALRRLLRRPPRRPERTMLSPAEAVLFGLYLRIFVMQVTIILGAWLAMVAGTAGAYVVLVALKTAIDLAFQVFADAARSAWIRAKARAAASRAR